MSAFSLSSDSNVKCKIAKIECGEKFNAHTSTQIFRLTVVDVVDDDRPDRTYAIASMNGLATSK